MSLPDTPLSSQVRSTEQEETVSSTLISVISEPLFKPCPYCNVMTERTGGCKWMKCRCKQLWCWHCGKINGRKVNHICMNTDTNL